MCACFRSHCSFLSLVLRSHLQRKAVDIEKSPVQRRGSSSGGASPQRRRGSQQSPRRSTSMVYGNTVSMINIVLESLVELLLLGTSSLDY